jgi:hypothetical protein
VKPKCRNHRSRWTLRELRYVEKHYQKDGAASVALKLGRTAAAVRSQASSMGCSKGPRELWTDEEMEILRINYARGDGISSVMQLLPGRSRKTIFHKAITLGISSARNWSEEECLILVEYYPVLGTKVGKMIGRTAEAVRIKASEMGIKVEGLTLARKWSEEETSLLLKNLDKTPAEIRSLFPDRTPASVSKARLKWKKKC